MFVGRVVYDMLFFFIVIIIVLNLIFGVIIDTFADLRSEKQNKEEILKNTCFICGEYSMVVNTVNQNIFWKFGLF
jgi:inositol 1,4,5-triphosphate receptor type 1